MKNLTLFIFVIMSTGSALANGTVNYLKIVGDVVVFGTSAEKAVASPACAVGSNEDKWTINLNTDSGKANYALLMSAMAGKLAVEIDSAQDCADSATVERALSVTINGSSQTDVNLPTYYTSCADILRLNPGSADGVYIIDPDLVGPSLPFKAYCDMTNDEGGWTLVMRAKEGDTDGWQTEGFLNFQRATDPTGGTFKYSDQLMNSLYSKAFRITKDEYTRPVNLFFRSEYHHFEKRDSKPLSVLTYEGSSLWPSPRLNPSLKGFYYYLDTDKIHIATNVVNVKDAWYVGNGNPTGYTNGHGEKGSSTLWLQDGLAMQEASFTMWVK